MSLSLLILCSVISFNHIAAAAASTNCPNPTSYQLKPPPLTTEWTSKVGSSPWPQYPRPLLRRDQWLNLNGPWQFKVANTTGDMNNPPFGGCFDREILVPFPMESGLSGIMENHIFSWYRKTFVVPKTWSSNVTVNFGAVDYEATVFVNGKRAGFHRGGYFRFSIDVTEFLKTAGEENELLISVYDPTNSKDTLIPLGKQVLQPNHIFYTPSSGIWQTVFLEPVPKEHVVNIDIDANMHGEVKARVTTSDSSSRTPVKLTLFPAVISSPDSALYPNATGSPILQTQATANAAFQFKLDNPQLWSPSTPHLYHFQVQIGEDVVKSYLGFRTVEKKKDENGIFRPFLNGEFNFQFGTLDQGFWPDGLHAAPTFEAMQYDIQVLKKVGFNMVRKHIKIEPDLYYYACDRIGILVWQDMPAMNPDLPWPTDDQQKEFVRQLQLMVSTHNSFPSIVTWIIYNEGWGQLGSSPERELAPMVKQMDPTRLVNAVSGWRDMGAGEFHDNHHYPYPQCGTPFYSLASTPYDPARIAVQGEFGGIGHIPLMNNLWNVPKAIETLNQTYEVTNTIDIWNYRAIKMVSELREQAELWSCSGAIYTQTTDVEGETNGLMTYDRRILRTDLNRWNKLITAVYAAAKTKKNSTSTESTFLH